ncbi:adhesion G protein-coupled receptor G3 [Amia ocellicauda]|uniref:adhesion G protein-coupled receptor G3 n=1 Tax=Amia ocellicauda TaxID=2972642 RepID=UPI003463F5AF
MGVRLSLQDLPGNALLFPETGLWNTTGCQTIVEINRTVCRCSHLTFFALLLQVPGISSTYSLQDLQALSYISLIGCGLSAFFTAVTIILYLTYKLARRDSTSTIHVCLCASLLLLYLLFLVNVKLASLVAGALCAALGGALHYALLSSLNWMAIEALHLYLLTIRVYNSYFHRYVLKLSIFGWGETLSHKLRLCVTGLPLLAVIIVGSLKQYGKLEVRSTGNQTFGQFCWLEVQEPRVVYLLNLAYMALLFLCSLGIFITVCSRIWTLRHSQPHNQSQRMGCRDVGTMLGLSMLLGTSWGFTFMGYGPLALPGLIAFTLINSLQGVFIFLMFFFMVLKVRREEKTASYSARSSEDHRQ